MHPIQPATERDRLRRREILDDLRQTSRLGSMLDGIRRDREPDPADDPDPTDDPGPVAPGA